MYARRAALEDSGAREKVVLLIVPGMDYPARYSQLPQLIQHTSPPKHQGAACNLNEPFSNLPEPWTTNIVSREVYTVPKFNRTWPTRSRSWIGMLSPVTSPS